MAYSPYVVILVSGHDLKGVAGLLEQTEGKGINISDMSTCYQVTAVSLSPPNAHLIGNYGGAWQDQRKEHEASSGAILMITY